MMINKIKLDNFGVFEGETTFDLNTKPKSGKSIILFGGKNGSGKTTIFDAIKLCLYGKSFNGKQTVEEYSDYIKTKFHHSSNKDSTKKISVELQFEQTTMTSKDQYTIVRTWRIEADGKISETLDIVKNDRPLQDLDSQNWQNFIKEIMPPGITQLFFFDGERIQQIADDKTTSIELRESIKMLLGLDLVDRLQADLSIYKSKKLLTISDAETAKRILELKNECEGYNENIEKITQERAQNESAKAHLSKGIERQEKKIYDEAGSFASKRNDIKNEIATVSVEINNLEEDLRNKASDTAPFIFAPDISEKLLIRINEEMKVHENQVFRKKIAERLTRLNEKDVKSNLNKLGIVADNLPALKHLIADILDIDKIKLADIKVLHGFSEQQYAEAKTILDAAKTNEKLGVLNVTKTLENLYQKRLELETLLNKAPSDDIIAPLMAKLSELNQELGMKLKTIQKIDEEIGQLQFKVTTISRNIEKIEEEIESAQKRDLILFRVNSSLLVLKEYSDELKKKKLRELESKLLVSFNRLIRKRNFISRIEINDEDFSITLHKSDGKIIPKERLSAGEKQIFAIALLWALTLVSNRKLPFVIDTPLGRLDSEHRTNLMERFFPHCGHQVIILSTDTEIDKTYFDIIRPNISATYHLSYNHERNATEVSTKYFWN